MNYDLLYRMLCSFSVGMSLSVCGSLSQIITHNPMSSPSTLGLQAFVVLALLVSHFISLIFRVEVSSEFIIIMTLLLGVIVKLLTPKSKVSIYKNKVSFLGDKIVLVGLCFNLFVGAIFSFAHFLSMSLNIRFPTSIWYGHFKFANLSSTISMLLLLFLIVIFVNKYKRSIRYFNFGPDFMASLGLNAGGFQAQTLFIILIATAFSVSYFGVFSFLGLIFPHFLRSLNLFKNDLFLEASLGAALCGLILMALDALCYWMPFYGAEIPVGMLSSIVGALYLVVYFLRKII